MPELNKSKGAYSKPLSEWKNNERKDNVKFFLGLGIGLNPINSKESLNPELLGKFDRLSEIMSKFVDDKKIYEKQGGVELNFKGPVIDTKKIVDNFKKHNWNYNSASTNLHFFSSKDKNLLMYNEKEPLKLTIIKGNHSKEELVKGLTDFFENFSLKKPEKMREDWDFAR
jgi:hypothetical protein